MVRPRLVSGDYRLSIRRAHCLCAIAPDVAPFKSDEAMVAALGNAKEYTLKQFLAFAEKLHAKAKEFIANEGNGELPLEGTMPDMISPTEYYVSLQKIYQSKAEFDCLAIEHRVKYILKRIGRDPDSISRAYIKTYCTNSRKLRVCRYRSMEEEFSSPILSEVQKYFTDEDYWYQAL